jgi:hypothetical protein
MDYFQLDQDEREAQAQTQDLKDKYKLVFRNDAGLTVLADILVNLCYFGCRLDSNDKEQIGQYNVGIDILSRLDAFSSGQVGVLNRDKAKNIITKLITGGV